MVTTLYTMSLARDCTLPLASTGEVTRGTHREGRKDTPMARIGVALSGGGLPPGDIVDCIKLADELGYESAWMAEGHGGDQFAILSACAVSTRRILLGTSISSVFVRSVPTIAMAAATVDHLSNQRFILGLGSSHKVQVEPEHGVVYSKPLQRVRESVAIIRALLRDGVVSYHGEVITIERFDLWFTPSRKGHPHLCICSVSKNARIVWGNCPGYSVDLEHLELRRTGGETCRHWGTTGWTTSGGD